MDATILRDALEAIGKRRNKYGAKPEVVDGLRFDSRAEARRYRELKLLQAAGAIVSLRVHPEFPLRVNGVECGVYVGDFEYLDNAGHVILEDVKGVRTQAYRIKRKLVRALYGIDITEIHAGR